jgi:hypothetical protein
MEKLYSLRQFFLRLMLTVLVASVGSVWAQSVSEPQSDKTDSATQPPAVRGNISSASLTPKIVEPSTTPSLEGSDLKPFPVISGDVDTIDNAYTHEVTRVQWRPGDPIDLYIVKPAGIKNPPVILYLYSYPFENDRFLNHDFCKFLVKDGYAAIGFASALTGHRYHDRPMKEWFVSELAESLATSAHDVQMILNYLSTRGDVDMNRVGMFGDGSGAAIAILAAAVDPRIKTLDLLDPWGDWPAWIAKSTRIPEKERPDYLKPEWLANVAPLDPIKWLPQLKTPRIRIQLIKSVTVTPQEAQKKLEAAAPANAQIIHYENSPAFQQAIAGGKGFDWIKKQMAFRVIDEYSAAGQSQDKSSSSPQ